MRGFRQEDKGRNEAFGVYSWVVVQNLGCGAPSGTHGNAAAQGSSARDPVNHILRVYHSGFVNAL